MLRVASRTPSVVLVAGSMVGVIDLHGLKQGFIMHSNRASEKIGREEESASTRRISRYRPIVFFRTDALGILSPMKWLRLYQELENIGHDNNKLPGHKDQ
ncbi:hypothetical protein RRG08_013410 [Elysia crispata]|uniref:Uncharacterized protein n=1 Tax=Elysia crispata TaxID=231223 RepID=A0AAE0ZPL4_9GAST|nr:hypothetical protein RRG08_013410 [Elysia crispata]